LYTSAADGLSFNRLKLAVGFSGPTRIIRAAGNNESLLLYRISMEEQKDFAAIPTVFSTKPVTALPTTGGARNFMYCNPSARSKATTSRHLRDWRWPEPRFFIEESFDHCVAGNQRFDI
jgi:hypothetical protein